MDGQGNFGCFTKDTKVMLADGRNLSFEELVGEDEQGKLNYAFTIGEEGKILIERITRPRRTIKNAEIMKVILDNGEEIRCTLNHRFMLRNGEYREARHLKPGDSLMPLYARLSLKADDPNIEGYRMVLQPKEEEWAYVHHLADDWNIEHGVYPRSAGRVRHHADFNKLNNNPDNVKRMHWKGHWKLHYDLTAQRHKQDGKYRAKLAEGRAEFWGKEENRKKTAERLSIRNKKNWKVPGYRAKMRQNLSSFNRAYIAAHPEKRREFSERMTRTLKRLWQSPLYRTAMRQRIIKGNKNHVTNVTGKIKFIKICKAVISEGKVLSESTYERKRNEVYQYGHSTTWDKGLQKYFSNNPSLILLELNGNHKVARIEMLDEREDVYDLTVEGTHNFALAAGVFVHNSVDGDNAAAMRYTEVRMDRLAEAILADIEKETVDFAPNFDGSLKEPLVLPSSIPNLLVNGSSGIAVGMATNVPPHNLSEIVDAIVALIAKPETELEELMTYVKGPDFPTGGIIQGHNGIRAAYTLGRGQIRVRARVEFERKGKAAKEGKDAAGETGKEGGRAKEAAAGESGKEVIIVRELPYMVNKAELISTIAELVKDKKVEGISDLRDESDREGMRIVIELKRDANREVVLNQLYAHTQMENTFGAINLALVDGEPRVLTLKGALQEYLKFRQVVVRRRCDFEFAKASERAHILEGLQTALANIDPIVKTIKAAKSPQAAKEALVYSFQLSEKQALAILDMRLQRLTSLEREKIATEHGELVKRIAWLKDVLADEKKILEIIKEELLDVKKKFGDERRTQIAEDAGEIEIEDLIKEERVVVVLTKGGYAKRVTLGEYRVQGRGGKGVIGVEVKEEDYAREIMVCSTHDYLLCFTDKGNVHWLKAYKLPSTSRYGVGKAIVNLLELGEGENVAAMIPVREFSENQFLIMATKDGVVKRTSLSEYSRPRRGGIIAITLREKDELIEVKRTRGGQDIVLVSRQGMAIRFKEEEVREIGRTGQGVRGIRLREGDALVGMVVADEGNSLLTVCESGYGKRTEMSEYRVQGRGGIGLINIQTDGRNGAVVGVKAVNDGDDALLVNSGGTMIRLPVSDMRAIGRNTMGVRLMRLEEGQKVTAVAKVVEKVNENGVEGEEKGKANEKHGKDAASKSGPKQDSDIGTIQYI
ncbi:MAG: DNA topoisomerase (ATP-hydrolyzing) subunit A [Candidatus Burarchaeum sp.]|nr:DNA topoisomerase (ATP-hydrolyzing) subunit A [Candidatus Burarchaeum sp.]MDO8339067.1 DNA topoisomerase (ATP-hydrolyzing) subunit A [Candidatus Burarchaeum sp.]